MSEVRQPLAVKAKIFELQTWRMGMNNRLAQWALAPGGRAKWRKLFVFGVIMGLGQPAWASTFVQAINITSGSFSAVSDIAKKTSFDDFFTFYVGSGFTGSIVDAQLSGSGIKFDSAALLYSATGSAGSYTTTIQSWSFGTSSTESLPGPYSTLGAGFYEFEVKGNNGTGTNKSYTFSGHITTAQTAPVPEPETWLMLGIGAALVGFHLRRKSQAIAALALT